MNLRFISFYHILLQQSYNNIAFGENSKVSLLSSQNNMVESICGWNFEQALKLKQRQRFGETETKLYCV